MRTLKPGAVQEPGSRGLGGAPALRRAAFEADRAYRVGAEPPTQNAPAAHARGGEFLAAPTSTTKLALEGSGLEVVADADDELLHRLGLHLDFCAREADASHQCVGDGAEGLDCCL